jgi:hypothetical protein
MTKDKDLFSKYISIFQKVFGAEGQISHELLTVMKEKSLTFRIWTRMSTIASEEGQNLNFFKISNNIFVRKETHHVSLEFVSY